MRFSSIIIRINLFVLMVLIMALLHLIEPNFISQYFRFEALIFVAPIVCFVTTVSNFIFAFFKGKENNEELKFLKAISAILFIVSFVCLIIMFYVTL